MYDVVIVGAGITGLTAAHLLRKAGRSFRILEAEKPGGAIVSRVEQGFTIEQGPNVLLDSYHMRRLLTELDLGERVVHPLVDRFDRFVWHQGRAVAAPASPAQFFRCQLIEPRYRAWFVPRIFLPGVLKPAAEDVSIGRFVAPLFGERAIDHLIDPALKGIFGGDARKLSARSVFPDLFRHAADGGSLFSYFRARTSKTRGKRVKRRAFVLRGGMQTLIEALMQKGRLAPDMAKDRAVRLLALGGDLGFVVHTAGGEDLHTRSVYLTTSGAASAPLISGLDSQLAEGLASLRYASIAVVHAAVRRSAPVPPCSFGILFPSGLPSKLLGVMFNSSLFPHVAPADQHLLMACLGGPEAAEICDLDENSLYACVRQELEQRLGITDPRFIACRRWARAIPQCEVGHFRLTERMDAVERAYPGLRFIGADRGGVSVPDRIKAAYELVEPDA